MIPDTKHSRLSVLATGMGWYPADQGNGLDRVFHALFEHSAVAGIDIDAIVVGTGVVPDRGLHVVDSQKSLTRRLLAIRSMHDRISRNFDVIAAHFALYALPLLDRLGTTPFVVHFHGPWSDESRLEGASAAAVWFKKRIENIVYRRADRMIVLSEAFRRLLVERFDADESRIDVIPGGVDLPRFDTAISRSDARGRLGWPNDRPIAVSVRRLVHRVGLENLIDAIATVAPIHPDLLVMIAGRGPLERELKARVEQKGLISSVRFLGFVSEEELPLAYAAADVSLVPTVGLEGFGLIAAESLASGTPAMVTPVGGLPEVVSPLYEGLVFADRSPESIADGLLGWLEGSLELPTRSDCKAYAREHFDWDLVARRVRNTYERARR